MGGVDLVDQQLHSLHILRKSYNMKVFTDKDALVKDFVHAGL